jgi:flagellar assembly protein FliH
MTAPLKFMFDLDFAAGDSEGRSEPTIAVSAHEIALAETQANAYRDGYAAAEAKAVADAEHRAGAALERVAEELHAIGRALSVVEGRLEAEAVEVAVAVARKLAPELIAREPLAEIEALAAECFAQLTTSPHVVVRVSDVTYQAIRERLDEIARSRGFEGRLVILAEPEITPGDCRIEWADGGVVRDRAAAEAAITDAVNRYVTGRRNGAPPY